MITTSNGHTFDVASPTSDDVRISEIAHALGNLCRFTGHTSRFYSVLEHSLLVLRIARNGMNLDAYTHPRRAYLEMGALLHDAHEAYLGDVSTPVKDLLGPEYTDLAAKYDGAIAARANIGPAAFRHDLVKDADALALRIEAWDLLPGHGVTGKINQANRPPRDYHDAVPAVEPDRDQLRMTFMHEYLTISERIKP